MKNLLRRTKHALGVAQFLMCFMMCLPVLRAESMCSLCRLSFLSGGPWGLSEGLYCITAVRVFKPLRKAPQLKHCIERVWADSGAGCMCF